MLSPVYRILFSNFPFRRNILPVVQIQQRSSVHVISMASTANWVDEKKRILKLPLEEKRKLYKCTDYVTLPSVDAWDHYVKMHDLSSKKHNLEDEDYFQNVPMSPDQNIELAGKVALFQGDITKLEVDAIVNAANSRLKAGGGVDGAIHRAAGPLLQKECDTLGGCPTGEARITGGYNLPAKYVIHTVGPQDGSAPHLESCYKNSLKLLLETDLQSIAFPCISTGIYGFPNRLAAHIALRAARKFLEENPRLNKIIFCTFLPIDVDIYETLMKMYFPVL